MADKAAFMKSTTNKYIAGTSSRHELTQRDYSTKSKKNFFYFTVLISLFRYPQHRFLFRFLFPRELPLLHSGPLSSLWNIFFPLSLYIMYTLPAMWKGWDVMVIMTKHACSCKRNYLYNRISPLLLTLNCKSLCIISSLYILLVLSFFFSFVSFSWEETISVKNISRHIWANTNSRYNFFGGRSGGDDIIKKGN